MFLRVSDLQCLRDKLADGVLGRKLSRLVGGLTHSERTKAHWDEKVALTHSPRIRLFGEMPRVLERIAHQYDGKDIVSWVFEKYLAPMKGVRALSVGCGSGRAEAKLAALGRPSGVFQSIVGFDPSAASIRLASENAAAQKLEGVLVFEEGTIEGIRLEPHTFDVAFAFSSLHHLRDLHKQVSIIKKWLKPGGLIIAHEYIGPNRQQYSRQEVKLIQALFDALPERYRQDWHTKRTRTAVPIPGALLMWAYDPSEMVEAADIAPAIRSQFEVVEFRVELGTLLLCLLKEIAHNFPSDDPDANKVIDNLCDIELSLIESGMLAPHFGTFIARA